MLKISLKSDRLEILGKSALNCEQKSKAAEKGISNGTKKPSAGLCLKAALLQMLRTFFINHTLGKEAKALDFTETFQR